MSRKKSILGVIGIVAAVIVAIVAIGIVSLRTSPMQHYVLSKLESTVAQKLGTGIQVRSFNLHLVSSTIDLNDVTVEGNVPHSPRGPLLHVQHIAVTLRLLPLLHGNVQLNDITIDKPVAHLYVDSAGKNNVPTPPPSSGPSTNVFDLAVKHAVLNGGELYVNDRKMSVEADLKNLQFRSSYQPDDGGSYSGRLQYNDGKLEVGSYSPLPHSLNATFDANRERIQLSPVILSIGSSQIRIHANASNVSSNPSVQATYEANLDTAEFAKALGNPQIPEGSIRLSGNVRYVTQQDKPALDSLQLNGDISSPSLKVANGRFTGTIREIAAQYAISNGNAVVNGLRANLLGGRLDANLAVNDLSGTMKSHLVATLHDVSARDLQSVAATGSMQDVRLTGGTNATVKASWQGSMQDLLIVADASVHGQMRPGAQKANAIAIPVDALIRARYVGNTKQLTLNHSYVKLPETRLNLDGTLSDHSALQIGLQSSDLSHLESLAQAFSTSMSQVSGLGLAGSAAFNGTLRGSTATPSLEGHLTAGNLAVKGTNWRTVRANILASPSRLSVQNGYLAAANQGHVSVELDAALKKWSFTPSGKFDVKLGISGLAAAELSRLANPSMETTGTLSANIAIHGTQLEPYGQGTIVLTNGMVASEPVQAVSLSFQGTGDKVHGLLGARLPAGSANTKFTFYPKTQAYDVLLTVANLQLAKLQLVQKRRIQVRGTLNVNASGHGTINNPAVKLVAQIPKLQFKDQQASGVTLNATVDHHLATLDLASQAVNTGIRAHGTIALTDGYQANVTLNTGRIPLQPLLAAYAPQAEDATGQAEVQATLRGPLKHVDQLEAHVRVPVLSLEYQKFNLNAPNPILVDYAHGVLSIRRSTIRGTGTNLQFQGAVPLTTSAPASLRLVGTVDLQVLPLIAPDLRSSGQVRFDINSIGHGASSNLQGKIRIENVNLSTTTAPLGLQNANGILTLTNKRLDVTSFEGQVGGGTISAKGGVVIRPSVQFDLALSGSGLTLLYPQGIRSNLDTTLALTGTPDAALLSGQVRLDRVAFTPNFDLANFTAQFNSGVSSPPSTGFANDLQLQITLQTASNLNLVSRTLSLQGGANLRIQGTAANPVILGRADVTGGDVIFLANRYVIQGGSVAFANPTRTEPIVNIAATTTIDQYNINLRLEGPSDRLRTTYSSDPALPPVDIINLLAFGKTTEAQAANANTTSSLGPESVIASGISGQIAGQIQKIAGISQLSIDPVLGPNQGSKGARITIQQRVTSKLFVTFSTDVTSTEQQEIQVQYHLNPRWSVSADRDQNGGFGFDARVHEDF